jgi:predicted transcriptional regulator of viral defense system
MKPKNTLQKLQPLLNKPSFTSTEARAYGVSSATIAYYVKKNELKRIGHGIYRSAATPSVVDFRWEELIEASQRVKDGVICLATALSIYHLTEDMPSQLWIAIRKDTRHRTMHNTKVVRMRNLSLGKTSIKVDNFSLPIFDRERTIVDAFRYLGKEIALKSLKMALKMKGKERIDITKMQKYAKTLHVNIEPFLIALTL